MRIVSWNCNSSGSITTAATAIKRCQTVEHAIAGFDADIAVLQEFPDPHTPNTPHAAWHGTMTSRGIAVRTSAAYPARPVQDLPPSRSCMPLQIDGPTSFLLLAIWSHPEKSSLRNYVQELYTTIEQCRNHMRRMPTVIVGDFNSNSQWDALVGKQINHSKLAAMLHDEFGLMSCYHRYVGVEHGHEQHGTFHQYRHADRPFYIDYCFAPETWHVEQVIVGTHAEWSTRSDHSPLVVDVVAGGSDA